MAKVSACRPWTGQSQKPTGSVIITLQRRMPATAATAIARTGPSRSMAAVPRLSMNTVSTATEKAQSAPITGSLMPSARQWIEP